MVIFWFRRDLRLHDNSGLSAALSSGEPVLPVFVFDTDILGRLEDRDDPRVEFIQKTLSELDAQLRSRGSGLRVEVGRPVDVWKRLSTETKIKSVYCNHDYEPYALRRDSEVERVLSARGIRFRGFKDQVVFEKREVQKEAGGPYTVFTPYSKKWLSLLEPEHLRARKCDLSSATLHPWTPAGVPSLEAIGFRSRGWASPSARPDAKVLRAYGQNRNTPSLAGTSRLGLHLRFGTVSVREMVTLARKTSEAWLNELIWREFFMQILFHFPHVVHEPFRSEYKGLKWRDDRAQFEAWSEGRTGYPLVDAGMRELNETGFMHARVRMVAASFLVKHLLLDWRLGEAYFARRLLDFDLAANNGNWQWVAGTGCDAAPYFRVFNPEAQLKKFDPKFVYVKRWLPEFGTSRYPKPIVDHAFARDRVLAMYKATLSKARSGETGTHQGT